MDAKEESELIHEVRSALAHLYDFAYLQRHPLARRLVPQHAATAHTRGRALRRILLDAIEELNPGPNVPLRAPEQRPYAILFALYVEGKPEREVAESLGIVGRQVRRDRTAALEALAALLRDRHLPAAVRQGAPEGPEPLREESERLAQGREPVDLHELVQGLLPLLRSLASREKVSVLSQVRPGLPRPNLNRTLARQVLISLASQALQSLPLSRLSFEARRLEGAVAVGLRLQYRSEVAPGAELASHLEPTETLAAALGVQLRLEHVSGGEAIWLVAPLQAEMVVLVVDDNQELFALFERYTAGHPYRLVHASGADEALMLARSHLPHAITVDLMMPNRDGWELLQALRSDPATARIPVIVCSVLNESGLALSLGAQGYLKKPVSQAELLQALGAVKPAPWAKAAHPESPGDT